MPLWNIVSRFLGHLHINNYDFYFGWDYGHLGDYSSCDENGYKWTIEEIREEIYNVINNSKRGVVDDN